MIGREVPNCEPNSQQRRRAFVATIYAFSDEMLFETFYHCRPVLSDGHEANDGLNLEGRKWENVRWWYNLAHVCRRWRCLVLTSASRLGVCLLCTYGTPVADMLTYPPALPLILDYGDEDREITMQDEEGILLALRRRRRVRRIRLWVPSPTLRRLLATMDGEFPKLENLYIRPLTNDYDDLSFPALFHAPHLRHFVVRNVTYPLDMFHAPSPIPQPPSSEKNSHFVLYYHGPQLWRSLKMFVHILDDDSLLNIFHYCRPVLIDEDESDIVRILQGGEWDRERWWYKLARVCRRWRCLILASTSHLDLCLVCMPGTPVADMITISPQLPLVIDYIHDNRSITTEDEEGIILALQHRDRVRRIRLKMPLSDLQRLLPAIDGEFPMLEYLYITLSTKCNSWLILPNTFQAHHLRHFILMNFAFPIRSPLIMIGTGLVTLSLSLIPQSAFSHPNDVLQQISSMPQLETLGISFHSPVPNRDLARQLRHRPVVTRVTLPNLRWLGIQAPSTYMEALLPQMTTPLLERLQAQFFLQLNFSVPHLLEFITAAENLRFGSAKFQFHDHAILVDVYPYDGAPMFSFSTTIACTHIDWQVSFAMQLFCTLRTAFSTVEYLTLEFRRFAESSETNNEADRTLWRELLRSFNNVKILRVRRDLRGQISGSLQVDDGESPLELLPELREFHYSQSRFRRYDNPSKAFTIARQNVGRPVMVVLS